MWVLLFETDVTHEAVHALTVTPVLGFLVAILVEAWAAFCLAIAIVTGITTNLISDVLNELLLSDSVAFKAVHASVSALFPLIFVTGHGVFETSSTIVMAPAVVASFSTLISCEGSLSREALALVQERCGVQGNYGHCQNSKSLHCC
jgi:hypothetical protein